MSSLLRARMFIFKITKSSQTIPFSNLKISLFIAPSTLPYLRMTSIFRFYEACLSARRNKTGPTRTEAGRMCRWKKKRWARFSLNAKSGSFHVASLNRTSAQLSAQNKTWLAADQRTLLWKSAPKMKQLFESSTHKGNSAWLSIHEIKLPRFFASSFRTNCRRNVGLDRKSGWLGLSRSQWSYFWIEVFVMWKGKS